MKRGPGPKRKTPLKRSGGLSADVEKVRAFIERGRGGVGRSEAKPLRKRRKKRPAEGPLDPAKWAESVIAASGGRSMLGGTRVFDDPPHHVISKQELRKRGLFHVVWDPRNGMALTLAEHDDHERWNRRIRRGELPPSAIEFATELGDWALAYIERNYPK